MPELWAPVDGANRKLSKLYAADQGGVNRKLKSLWAGDGAGVARKIFSGADCQGRSIFGTIYADGRIQSGQERRSTSVQYPICDLIFNDPIEYTSGQEFARFVSITSYFAYATNVYLYDEDAENYIGHSELDAFGDRSGYTVSSLPLTARESGSCRTIRLLHTFNSTEDAGYFTIDKMQIGGITINNVELI